MSDFRELPDLASALTGGAALHCTDDFFASMDNLLKPEKAIFIEGKYTDRGKWMDGWESRRKRVPGHDFCILRLGMPGIVRGVVVDTAFFRGNYPSACSIEGVSLHGNPDVEALLSPELEWTELLPRVDLSGDSSIPFEVHVPRRVTHLRFHIHPDGGVARLRVHGEVQRSPKVFARPELDLASIENGARVVACNDMFFGSRHNLIMPNRASHMGDGWETKRSRRPGPDWVIVQLAGAGAVHRALVDTLHFRGNAPSSCSLEVCDAGGQDPELLPESGWTELLPRTRLLAHTQHEFEDELSAHPPATHVRMRIWPDGGVSRLRLFGALTEESRERAGLAYLASLSARDREAALLQCCGSRAWAAAMAMAACPFASLAAMKETGRALWRGLSREDWDEAFRAHPELGGKKAEGPQSESARRWSEREQSRVGSAPAETLERLARANAGYRERFGRIYIACATGKSAEELLALAETRLTLDPEAELEVAAREQQKITDLRIDKLIFGR